MKKGKKKDEMQDQTEITVNQTLTAEQAEAMIAALAETLGVPVESITITDKDGVIWPN